MGTFRVRIEVGNESRRRFEPVEALVDAAASHTVRPRRLLDELGVRSHTRAQFLLADGRTVELEMGRAWVRIEGDEEVTLVVFGDEALLGAVTLEELRLAPDPVGAACYPSRDCRSASPPDSRFQ